MKDDEVKAFCYLYRTGDERNKCILTDQKLAVYLNNKEFTFPLSEILYLRIENRRTMLPLIAGGIIVPLSLIAIFNNIADPWLIITLFVTGCLSLYSGWLGHKVISVQTTGGVAQDLKIKYAGDPLYAFLDFTNEILKQGTLEEIKAPHIYHIVSKNDWRKFSSNNNYSPPSLKAEGFIHCSTKNQLKSTIQKFFADQKELLLLSIDPLKVKPEIKYEYAKDAEGLFPHIYGPLNLDSIVKEENIEDQ